jgi:tRNA(Ile)-lysidine synthase
MNIPDIVRDNIEDLHLLGSRETVLAAVSGGADSLCLLLVLLELGFPVCAAHFDHGLRPDSAEDSETVRRIAEKLGVRFFTERGDVRDRAKQKRETLEEAARELRYDFLRRTAAACGAPAVATGHTADDQAETVLMHLLRGSGLQGLRGIRPDFHARGMRIVRPLLCLTHAQTLEYCRDAGWHPLEDPSNLDRSFKRNRIRGELIPQLKKYNPQIVPILGRLSDLAAAQTDLLDRMAEDVWNRCLLPSQPGEVRILREAFNQSPMAVRQAIVRRAVKEMSGSLRDLAYRHVQSVIGFSLAPTTSRRMTVALGIDASVESQSLVFRKREVLSVPAEWENAPLPIPGEAAIRRPNWKFQLVRKNASEFRGGDAGKDPWAVRVDEDKIHPPLFLRKRAVGDRFFPAGMPGPVKLNDFLAAQHLPLAERDHWPLVCDREGILWIPGFRLRQGMETTGGTGRCVEIQVLRPSETDAGGAKG